jgi:hypothetical protein
MSAFDPLTFLTDSHTNSQNKCDYFGFKFESEFDPDVWPKLCDNFFFSSLRKVQRTIGSSNVITVGVFGEANRSNSFVLTDCNTIHIMCATCFKVDIVPGTLLLINCPEIVQTPSFCMKLKSPKQIVKIGFVNSFGLCDRHGSHLACTKFIDRSKDTLCSFHKAYYRLKAANQLKIQTQVFPRSMPVVRRDSSGSSSHTTQIHSLFGVSKNLNVSITVSTDTG